MLTLIWILGTFVTAMGMLYMKGRSDKRFAEDKTYLNNPPWIAGVLLSWMWPVLYVAGGIYLVGHTVYGHGAGRGATFNAKVRDLDKLAQEWSRATDRNLRELVALKVDPGDINEQTMRALNARAIEWGMEDDARIRRERLAITAGDYDGVTQTPAQTHRDAMIEVLTKEGVPIPALNPLDLT